MVTPFLDLTADARIVELLTRGESLARTNDVIIPIDKPPGWSSFDVVRKLRRLTGVRKIGHAGTLDPMATGLLICGVGRGTKLLSRFVEMHKEYSATIRLGEETESYDADTPVIARADASRVTEADLDRVRSSHVGEIIQKVPPYSAVKVRGERLYRKARRGEVFDTPPRAVSVYAFEMLDRRDSDVFVRVECSKGTYIRSLAHDIGRELGVGAHLVALRRTRIGDINVDQAWRLDEFEQFAGGNAAPGASGE